MNEIRIEGDSKNKRFIELKLMTEGDYQISNEGHIISLKGTKKLLSPKKTKRSKDKYIKLYKNGSYKHYNVSKLVDKYFNRKDKNP